MTNIVTVTASNSITFKNVIGLDLEATLHCGQAFRWSAADKKRRYTAVVSNKRIMVSYDAAECALTVTGPQVEKDEIFLRSYFDLDRDYEEIKRILSQDETLAEAVRFAPGIHILKQDPWETLGSFIFSSNNNITRITNMVELFCRLFGKPAQGGGYCFPSVERVASLHNGDLAPLKCGYRDNYILDAAYRVASGDVSFDAVTASDIEDARLMLMQIRGVGQKVADCTLLFGFDRMEAFPKDVHIRRAMHTYFPNGLPACALPYAGIAQQYLFHWVRMKEN